MSTDRRDEEPLLSLNQCRCPTCGVVQDRRNECRRCRTELAVLNQIADEAVRTRGLCFYALRNGDWHQAARLAERLMQLYPTPFHEVLCEFCGDFSRRS